jgi:flagellar basal-body rod protein FlgB
MSSIFSDLQPLERMLDYHLERQNVINANLANVNTPGYREKDLAAPSPTTEVEAPLETTNAAHLQGEVTASAGQLVNDGRVSPGNDKNDVSLEHEMAKLMANSVRYEAGCDIISRRLAMLRYAASDGQG